MDPKKVGNKFNQLFTNIATKLGSGKKVSSSDVPRGIVYQYTIMGVQILAPKNGNTPLIAVIFSITGYASSF